jgi:acyl-CoA thioesterase FadM
VNFRKPMRVGHPYVLVSWIEGMNGRKNMLRGEVRDAVTDTLIADADALFITVTPPSAA